MLELTLSRSALGDDALAKLMQKGIKTLMWWERIPDTPEARKIAWSFANPIDDRFLAVGGLAPRLPRFRWTVHTIDGLLDERAKQGVIRDLTRVTLDAVGSPHDFENAARVWCIIRECPRNCWGIGGYPFGPSGYLSALDEIETSPGDGSE